MISNKTVKLVAKLQLGNAIGKAQASLDEGMGPTGCRNCGYLLAQEAGASPSLPSWSLVTRWKLELGNEVEAGAW
jgi:hypothetical protein